MVKECLVFESLSLINEPIGQSLINPYEGEDD